MTSVAEKARFYLERTVPQLREWEELGIFTKEEIRSVVKKRNDYELRVLAPRNRATHFSDYAAYERSLALLLRHRMRRLHIHSLPGQRAFSARAAGILERGVDRHPTNPALWHEYLAECAAAPRAAEAVDVEDGTRRGARGKRSTKRWRKGITRALRLLPTNADLWVMAGRRAVDDGDWEGARGMFMRGCRFCVGPGGEAVWLEFAACEMRWLDRMETRANGGKTRKALADVVEEDGYGDEIPFEEEDDQDEGEGGSRFVLPEPGRKEAAHTELEQTAASSTPAMSGAIPRSIFDVATRQAFYGPGVAYAFFALFATFRPTAIPLAVTDALVRRAGDELRQKYPAHVRTALCAVTQPVAGWPPRSVGFVRGLRETLARLWTHDVWGRDEGVRIEFARELDTLVDSWLDVGEGKEGHDRRPEELDAGVRAVLQDVKVKLAHKMQQAMVAPCS